MEQRHLLGDASAAVTVYAAYPNSHTLGRAFAMMVTTMVVAIQITAKVHEKDEERHFADGRLEVATAPPKPFPTDPRMPPCVYLGCPAYCLTGDRAEIRVFIGLSQCCHHRALALNNVRDS